MCHTGIITRPLLVYTKVIISASIRCHKDKSTFVRDNSSAANKRGFYSLIQGINRSL